MGGGGEGRRKEDRKGDGMGLEGDGKGGRWEGEGGRQEEEGYQRGGTAYFTTAESCSLTSLPQWAASVAYPAPCVSPPPGISSCRWQTGRSVPTCHTAWPL